MDKVAELASPGPNQLEILLAMFDPGTLLLLLLGFFLLWAVNWFIRQSCDGLMRQFPAKRFIILQLATLLSFTLYIGGTAFLIVGVLEPPKELLIAFAGSAAVALGFALKDVAASLVSGVLLLFDRPFQVGDRVTFGDIYGEIVAITLRSVRLQTLDDNTVTIPNLRFITEAVASGNMGAMDMMVVTDFHLALDADVEEARRILREVIVTSRYVYLKKPVTFTLEEVCLAEQIVIRLRTKAYVLDVRYEKALQSDITLRAAGLFNQAGIKRPPIR